MRAAIAVVLLCLFAAGPLLEPIFKLPFDPSFGFPAETQLAIFGLLALYALLEVVTLGYRIAGASKVLTEIKEQSEQVSQLARETAEKQREQIAQLESEKELLREQALGAVTKKQSSAQSTESFDRLLSKLQEEGRFLDFLMDDVSGVSNEQIGAAARVVQQGCKKALTKLAEIEPLSEKPEGSTIELNSGYNAAEWRLLGSVSDKPPYRGRLVHRGWSAKTSKDESKTVLYPAEVEIQ